MTRKPDIGNDLGPKQIAWLKARIEQFDYAWRSAEMVRAEMEVNRREMTPRPMRKSKESAS